MEAATNPASTSPDRPSEEDRGFLLNTFPELEGEFPLALCPESIRLITADLVETFHAPATAAAAVALAVAAAAIGPRYRVRVLERDTIASNFNVLIAHTEPRQLPWFDVLQSRFVGLVVAMQHALHIDGQAATRQMIKTHEADLAAARKSVDPNIELINEAVVQIARLRVRLRSDLILTRAAPQEILDALPKAFDGGLLCTTLGSDPLDDLALLKPQERRQLACWLNVQWEGRSIPRAPTPTQISLLWMTPVQALVHLARWREFHSGTIPVPLLILTCLNESTASAPPRLPHESNWEKTIEEFFDQRCGAEKETIFKINEEAHQPLWDFELHLRRQLHTIPREYRAHLAWLPGLAPRLALLFHLLDGQKEELIAAETVTRAAKIARWFGGKHLQAMVSALPLSCSSLPRDSTAPAAHPDAETLMLRKIQKKGAVSRRELWRSYDRPRAEQFDASLNALLEAGKIQRNEENKLIAVG